MPGHARSCLAGLDGAVLTKEIESNHHRSCQQGPMTSTLRELMMLHAEMPGNNEYGVRPEAKEESSAGPGAYPVEYTRVKTLW